MTTCEIVIDVTGLPASQGSHQAFVNPKTGRAIITTAGSPAVKQAHKEWREAVCNAGIEYRLKHPMQPLDEPVRAQFTFWMPLTASDPYRTRYATKPDWDKIVRSTCDSLSDAKILFDDSRIFDARVVVMYARPGEPTGVRIRLWGCGDEESADRERLIRETREMRKASKA